MTRRGIASGFFRGGVRAFRRSWQFASCAFNEAVEFCIDLVEFMRVRFSIGLNRGELDLRSFELSVQGADRLRIFLRRFEEAGVHAAAQRGDLRAQAL